MEVIVIGRHTTTSFKLILKQKSAINECRLLKQIGMNVRQGLKDQISEIENTKLQKIRRETEIKSFELRADKWLVTNLSGNYGALFIRSILQQLSVDEFFVLKWRLENKFKQYQIFNHYFPGCMPETLSFSELLKKNNGIQKIKDLFLKGFFLKATLGDASYITQSWDKTAEFDQIIKLPNISGGEFETYMLQNKLTLSCEFRVHTFSKEIIPALTYIIQGDRDTNNFLSAENFIKEILQKLPDTILQGTLIAWDIALTNEGQYYIIEGNFTGFHPEYRRGFQTTGYVDNHDYGAIICAWLNIYFKQKFGIYVDAVEDGLFLNYPFYRAFVYYMSVFKKEHINLVRNKTNQIPYSVIIYLGEESNQLVINLIKHFLLVGYASKYHVIVRDDSVQAVFKLFAYTRGLVLLHLESELFTRDQFKLIKQLGYERRKQVCCYHVLRDFHDGVII